MLTNNTTLDIITANNKYSQTLEFAPEYKHEYCSFLSSPHAEKRDIAVTVLPRCMCVRVCMHTCLPAYVRPDLSGS